MLPEVFVVLRALFLLAFIFSSLHADKGTLIVTYKTGERGERLDRVRFWLINELREQQMFPRKSTFVDDQNALKRIVVIKDLKPGKYTLDFVIPNQDDLFEPISPKEITIAEDKITEIEQVIKPRYASLQAASAPMTSKISLKNASGEQIAYQSDLSVKNLSPGNYTLHYDEVPGYTPPQPHSISLGNNEQAGPFVGVYTPSNLLPVPEGEVIVGNVTPTQNQRPARTFTLSAFSIGKYEVTNREFAAWLTNQSKKITLQTDGTVTQDGHLLYKTKLADTNSEIEFKDAVFTPDPGREDFPLINVTWYGANAYCKDNNCRLPTEAEWEKAAGMEKGKKYLYGFSQDTIDPSWANYRPTDKIISQFELLTTKVGSYNGNQKTHNATSPIGAYDMSGNVWEWVSDWYAPGYEPSASDKDPQGPAGGDKKVVKGGCYDSLATGVQVAERLGLPPDHADPYTGFRVVGLQK